MAEHTRTPWKRGACGGVYPADGGARIANCLAGKHGYRANGEANAAFIVTACNSHDALVEECQVAMRVYERIQVKLLANEPCAKNVGSWSAGIIADLDGGIRDVRNVIANATPEAKHG